MKRGCDVVNNHLNKDKDLMLVEGDSVAAVGSACSKCVLKQQKKKKLRLKDTASEDSLPVV